MEKLEKYASFDEMKDSSVTGTVQETVIMERHKKFEAFINFIRGDNPPEKSLIKTKQLSPK